MSERPVDLMAGATPPDPAPLDPKPLDPRFREELETVFWLQQEVREGRGLPVMEAEAATHSLYVALQADGPNSLPQLPLHHMSQYVAVHAVNVSLLAMALGEFTGHDGAAVRDIGMAALLHDIGMAFVPMELLASPGPLERPERERVKEHTLTGARVILEAKASLGLAAVVAWEHHLRPDGSGYPVLTFPRSSHPVSRLVQLCDIYHALSSPRPFRGPWPPDVVYSFIRARAGFEFDPDLATRLIQMLEQRTGVLAGDHPGAEGPALP